MTPIHTTWILYYPTELKFSMHVDSKSHKTPDTFRSERSDNFFYTNNGKVSVLCEFRYTKS